MRVRQRSLLSWIASIGLVLTSVSAAHAEEEYIGVFRSGQGGNLIDRHDTWDDLIAEGNKRMAQNLRLVDVEAIRDGSQTRYISIWQSGTDAGNIVQKSPTWDAFLAKGNELIAQNLRLVDLEVVGCTPSSREFIGVWRSGTDGNILQRSQGWESFLKKGNELINAKLRLIDVEAARTGSQIEYFGTWRSGTEPGNLVVRSESWEDFLAKGNELIAQNLRLVDVDVIRLASAGKKQYLSVWRSGNDPGNIAIRTNSWQDFLAKGQELVTKGLRLVDMSVLGSPCPGSGQNATKGTSGSIGTQPSRPARISRIEYLGNFPNHRQSGWSHDLQGVANDANNWFFTQQAKLWKFPVSHDLNDKVTDPNPGKGILEIGIPKKLSDRGFDHYGDLDQYRGFLFIPLEDNHGNTNEKPVIAVFRAADLAFIGSAPLITPDGSQGKSGWVAVHPISGLLYTSNNTIDKGNNPIFVYKFNLQDLKQNRFKLEYHSTLYLRDEQSNKITLKPYLQGGVFSSDGNTLFLVNGKARDFNAEDGGIWVFDAKTGKKLMKSAQSGSFKYEFHPGKTRLDEEPEGITFWDLDNGKAPRIPGGQLHAILLDKDTFLENPLGDPLKDEFYLKHYRIHYDRN